MQRYRITLNVDLTSAEIAALGNRSFAQDGNDILDAAEEYLKVAIEQLIATETRKYLDWYRTPQITEE